MRTGKIMAFRRKKEFDRHVQWHRDHNHYRDIIEKIPHHLKHFRHYKQVLKLKIGQRVITDNRYAEIIGINNDSDEKVILTVRFENDFSETVVTADTVTPLTAFCSNKIMSYSPCELSTLPFQQVANLPGFTDETLEQFLKTRNEFRPNRVLTANSLGITDEILLLCETLNIILLLNNVRIFSSKFPISCLTSPLTIPKATPAKLINCDCDDPKCLFCHPVIAFAESPSSSKLFQKLVTSKDLTYFEKLERLEYDPLHSIMPFWGNRLENGISDISCSNVFEHFNLTASDFNTLETNSTRRPICKTTKYFIRNRND